MKLNTINTKNSSDLINILNNIDITVPERSKGRKTEHTEIWSIVRYLLMCHSNDKLDYPLSLIHQDRPDFLLKINESDFGIECTEAIPEQMAWAQELWEKSFPNSYFEPDLFKWGSRRRNKKEIMEILKKTEQGLHGSGWIGNSVETEWSKWMLQSVNFKTKKLNKVGFQKYSHNQILMYDNLPQSDNDLSIASSKFSILLKKYWDNQNLILFDKIFIESHDIIVEFDRNQYSPYQIPNVNDII